MSSIRVLLFPLPLCSLTVTVIVLAASVSRLERTMAFRTDTDVSFFLYMLRTGFEVLTIHPTTRHPLPPDLTAKLLRGYSTLILSIPGGYDPWTILNQYYYCPTSKNCSSTYCHPHHTHQPKISPLFLSMRTGKETMEAIAPLPNSAPPTLPPSQTSQSRRQYFTAWSSLPSCYFPVESPTAIYHFSSSQSVDFIFITRTPVRSPGAFVEICILYRTAMNIDRGCHHQTVLIIEA
ncbi:hypothetical protein AB1N83_011631 [Pleurotus pulmonarius]